MTQTKKSNTKEFVLSSCFPLNCTIIVMRLQAQSCCECGRCLVRLVVVLLCLCPRERCSVTRCSSISLFEKVLTSFWCCQPVSTPSHCSSLSATGLHQSNYTQVISHIVFAVLFVIQLFLKAPRDKVYLSESEKLCEVISGVSSFVTFCFHHLKSNCVWLYRFFFTDVINIQDPDTFRAFFAFPVSYLITS